MATVKLAPVQKSAPTLAQRFKSKVLHGYFVRFHMSLILTAVIASGVLTSKLMLMAGVLLLPLRYALAVLFSYLVFLGMVRLWIWYVMARPDWGSLDFGNWGGSVSSSGGGGGGGGIGSGAGKAVEFGGGDSGGGGASAMWVENPVPGQMPAVVPEPGTSMASSGSSGSGFHLPDLNLDLGDDGWWIVLLLAVVVIVIICAGGYLIYVAPDILPEAAWQVALAHGINRASKNMDPKSWALGVMRASVIPMAIVLIAAVALGWYAHSVCPHAVKLAEAMRCTANIEP